MTIALRVLPLLAVLLLVAPSAAPAQTTEADVYVAQALLDLDEKRYEAALENLRKALEIEPDHVEALYYTGVVQMARREPQLAIPPLARARQKSPSNVSITFQLALAYFALQRYEEAQPLLEQVFRTDPTIDGLGYYVGFLRYRQKDYRGALRAFRTGRASDPAVQQLTRFYTGLALGVLGEKSQAAAEVEQALRLAPSSPLTGPAERLRESIIASARADRRWTAEARFGFLYDDNVAVIPDRDVHEPIAAELRQPRHESMGELLGLRVGYSWLRDVWNREDWDSTIEAAFFGTYMNDVPKFNVLDQLFSVSVAHRVDLFGMPMQPGGQYAWDIVVLGDREFLRRHTLSLFTTLVENERHLTQVVARYQNKQFNETLPLPPKAEFRDADNWMAGFTHLLRFAEDQHYVKLGYQLDYDDTRGTNYEYLGSRFLVGGQYTLPWLGVRLKYDLDAHIRGYRHRNTLLPTTDPGSRRRQDEELTQIARVELPLRWLAIPGSSLFTDKSFTLAGEYQRTDARSNLAAFDYTRNVISLTLSWTY